MSRVIFGEADQLVSIPNGIDQHAGPEAAAVLPHSPAFAFELAGLGGRGQSEARQARCAILRRIELRKMLADDFLGAVPLDAFRAGIPGINTAAGVDHVDRAIADTLQ